MKDTASSSSDQPFCRGLAVARQICTLHCLVLLEAFSFAAARDGALSRPNHLSNPPLAAFIAVPLSVKSCGCTFPRHALGGGVIRLNILAPSSSLGIICFLGRAVALRAVYIYKKTQSFDPLARCKYHLIIWARITDFGHLGSFCALKNQVLKIKGVFGRGVCLCVGRGRKAKMFKCCAMCRESVLQIAETEGNRHHLLLKCCKVAGGESWGQLC